MSAHSNYNLVVIHYDEIGLKGKNRKSFENLLAQNIRRRLSASIQNIRMERGRIVLVFKSSLEISQFRDALETCPGISYFSPAISSPLDFEKIKGFSIEIAKSLTFDSFKVNAKRSNKTYALNSSQINIELGAALKEVFPEKKIQMVGPDLTLKVEIADKWAYLSVLELRAVGGFPTDSNQKVMGLISGGFDSPVASYLMMKRGCEVSLVHFLNENQNVTAVKDKILKITQVLARFQNHTELTIIPFGELQRHIVMKVHSTLRMLIYRRFMLKIASQLARQKNARFLVVGDSLSQVASQTIENLEATYQGSPVHVLSPLIGLNKNEIMDTSRKIGTFDISSLQHEDCCSFFMPDHPELRSNAEQLQENERLILNQEELIQQAIANRQVFTFPNTAATSQD